MKRFGEWLESKSNPADLKRPWRVGRTVGRTIYVQLGSDAEKGDELIGLMDTRELAAFVVKAVNYYQSLAPAPQIIHGKRHRGPTSLLGWRNKG